MKAISVVIPAFNEEAGIAAVIAEIRRILEEQQISPEVIVIDDGSTDGTARNARSAGARLLQHRSNRGYGAALKSGIANASNELIVITDADGTYPAEYIPRLLEQLDRADMVVGARTGRNVRIPLIRKPAKLVLNWLANYLTNSKIPDLNSGLRAFRRGVVEQYFPIDYRKREGKSKIVPWDAGSFLVLILRTAMLFRPIRIFLPIVGLFLLYGLAKT